MYQKWPKSIFPCVNFIVSHHEIWVQGGEGCPPLPLLLRLSAVLIHLCPPPTPGVHRWNCWVATQTRRPQHQRVPAMADGVATDANVRQRETTSTWGRPRLQTTHRHAHDVCDVCGPFLGKGAKCPLPKYWHLTSTTCRECLQVAGRVYLGQTVSDRNNRTKTSSGGGPDSARHPDEAAREHLQKGLLGPLQCPPPPHNPQLRLLWRWFRPASAHHLHRWDRELCCVPNIDSGFGSDEIRRAGAYAAQQLVLNSLSNRQACRAVGGGAGGERGEQVPVPVGARTLTLHNPPSFRAKRGSNHCVATCVCRGVGMTPGCIAVCSRRRLLASRHLPLPFP